VNKAHKERIIQHNPITNIRHISKGQSEKHFLYEEELERVINADCPREVWKQAFLFSCFTGLRLSDVEQLTWGKI
jgi:integrase